MHKKKCWQCAELINVEALVCPNCRGKQPKYRPPVKPWTKTQINRVFGVSAAVVLLVVISVSMSPKQAPAPANQTPIASASESPPQLAAPAAYKVEILAMRRLKATMRDPESMETRNVRVPSGRAYLCGEVNGANAFGGKAGFKRFLVGGASSMPAVIEGDGQMVEDEFEKMWRQLC